MKTHNREQRKTESLFSRTGQVAEKDLWDVLVRYANGEDGAIEDFRSMLLKFGYGPRVSQGEGLPERCIIGHEAKQAVAEQAREDLENARLVLRWFSDPIGKIKDKERAVRILNERAGNHRRAYGPFPRSQPAEVFPLLLQSALEFDRPIDFVCALVTDQLAHSDSAREATVQSLRPIRTCEHCGKLFMRSRKSKFCLGGKCKSAHYNRKQQRADAGYQFRRRILRRRKKLTPRRFAVEVRMMVAKIKRGKLEPAEKTRRVRFLKNLMKTGAKT